MVDPTGKRETSITLDSGRRKFTPICSWQGGVPGIIEITEFAYYKKGWGSFQRGAAPIIRYGIAQFISVSIRHTIL